MKPRSIKLTLAILCVITIVSSLFFAVKPFEVKDSGDMFNHQLSEMYRKYTPGTDKYDTDKNPFALKRICATDYNGKRYGAAAIAYDKENDFAVLQYETEEEAKQAVFEMESDGVIAEPDSIAELDSAENGTMYPEGSQAVGSTQYINNIGMDTEEVIVAVIDTGVMYDHPAIADRFYSNGLDLSEDENFNAYYDTNMESENYYHSTAVCGVIADNTPDNVKILPIKVMSFSMTTAYSSTMVSAIYNAIRNGASVINMSMVCSTQPAAFQAAVNSAAKNGVIVCASIGNDSSSVTNKYPACCENAIGVSAVESDFQTLASFSNTSSFVDFTAPGRRINSTYASPDGPTFTSFSGTSFSAPYIASLCADIRSINKDLTNDEVYEILKRQCVDLGNDGFDESFGWGMPDLSDITYTDNESYSFSVPQGVLNITGSNNYEKEGAPWNLFAKVLKEVNIDNSIKSVGNYMFYNCEKADFNMPGTYDSVGTGAFYNCKSLESMSFDIDVQSIGNNAFSGIEGFVVKGYRNTPAESYALRENISFVKLGCKHEFVYDVYEPTSYRPGYSLNTCLICNETEIGPYRPSRVLASGSCGESLTYTVYENGKLFISGEGDMTNYFSVTSPFYEYRDIIKVLDLGENVKSISPFAFYGCNTITKIKCAINNPYLKTDGMSIVDRETNRLVLIAAKGIYNMPEEITGFDASAFIVAENAVVHPNSKYHINDNIIYDENDDIILALPNYSERILNIDRRLKIYPYAFIFCSYPEVVDTKQLNVEAGSFSLGFTYSLSLRRHPMTFKLGTKSKLFMYAINNNFDIEYYDLGVAGKDISWLYVEDEEALCFNGTGDMDTYSSVDEVPWSDYLPSVKKIVIDERITSLSPWAFNGAASLEELSIPVSIKPFEDDTTFDGAYYIKKLTITCGSGYSGDYLTDNGVHIYRYTPWFMSRKSIDTYSIDPNIKYIGREMFRNSLFLNTLTFNSLEEIAEDAFMACTGLTTFKNKCKTTVYNPYSVFSYNLSGTHGIYANKKLYGYNDSTSKDYANDNSINFISLGCGHSRNVEALSREPYSCCKERVVYQCTDCGTQYNGYEESGEGHNVSVSVATTKAQALEGAVVSLGGNYSATCDSQGIAVINGVFCGDYNVRVYLYEREVYSGSVSVDGGDTSKTVVVRYADFVRDGVINAKDYAYSLKHGFNDTDMFDYGVIEDED